MSLRRRLTRVKRDFPGVGSLSGTLRQARSRQDESIILDKTVWNSWAMGHLGSIVP